MIPLYDPPGPREFAAVVALLAENGIEFFTAPEADPATGQRQILVAEEDLPCADQLLRRLDLQGLRH